MPKISRIEIVQPCEILLKTPIEGNEYRFKVVADNSSGRWQLKIHFSGEDVIENSCDSFKMKPFGSEVLIGLVDPDYIKPGQRCANLLSHVEGKKISKQTIREGHESILCKIKRSGEHLIMQVDEDSLADEFKQKPL